MTFLIALGKQLKNHEKPDEEKKTHLGQQIGQATHSEKNDSLSSR